MSAWEVYWIMQADTIRHGVRICMVALVLPTIISGIMVVISVIDDGESLNIHKLSRRSFFFSTILLILSTVGVIFIPSTKTLCAVYVVPVVINNETLHKDLGEVYELGMERLKEVLSEGEKYE